MKTVVGLFDQFDEARRAVHDLRNAGFSNEDISMIANDESGEYSRYLDADKEGMKEDVGEGAATGAGIGAVLGGLGGLLVGLGALLIPGIGPVIAAGPIVTTLAGAGVGAVAGGIVGALVDLGIPEEHAGYYAEGVRRGGTLVVTRTDDMRADQAADIMNRYHPVDVEKRASTWRETGWTGFNAEDATYRREHTASNIPVTGDEDFDKTRSDREFDRSSYRSKDRDLDDDIPVTGGVVRDTYSETTMGQDVSPMDRDWAYYDTQFRTDYMDRYGSTGQSYNYYQPAYRFGYDLATDMQYRDWDWDRMEPVARQEWERRGLVGAWEDFKDTVRYAWNSIVR